MGVHVETLGGGMVVKFDATPGVRQPITAHRCCDDRQPCIQPSWGSAYWHAVYRSRRTGLRQTAYRVYHGKGWRVAATTRPSRHKRHPESQD